MSTTDASLPNLTPEQIENVIKWPLRQYELPNEAFLLAHAVAAGTWRMAQAALAQQAPASALIETDGTEWGVRFVRSDGSDYVACATEADARRLHALAAQQAPAAEPSTVKQSLTVQPAAEPVAPANKWDGGEGWESLAWELCADEHGEDACTELIWEGGPVPEPWGDRWLKYEGEAKRLIALVHKHVPAAPQPPQAQPLTDEQIAWCIFEARKEAGPLLRNGTLSFRIARLAVAEFCRLNGIKGAA